MTRWCLNLSGSMDVTHILLSNPQSRTMCYYPLFPRRDNTERADVTCQTSVERCRDCGSWGEGSVGKVFAVQAWGPECDPQNHVIPALEMEIGRSLEHTDQVS